MPEETLNTADLPAPSYASSDSTPAAADGAAPTAAVRERYQLLAEIAQGGMGVVHRALDTTLNREVAVKVLQARYDPDSGIARRFADEAHIAAQLQHPAIPPIHDLGTLPDGRPFLAMKLIKGRTLEALLHARSDPAAERGRFVAVFEQVCQAMAYAHAHHVIHRDLKPANVMVGAYGEVQVMDWGLSKVLGVRPSEAADPETTRAGTEVVSLRDSDGLYTEAGSVLGTPAFMPPEQAIGAVAKVDQRSDVFGLGAILAVILSGQPPFAAASAETARVKAAQGDISDCFARLDGCGAEPELVALCKRCLNPKASERPADGGEVAAAVAGLRQAAEERARTAELERVRAEGERAAIELRAIEQRKRRRVQFALVATVALLLVVGISFTGWYVEQRRVVRYRQIINAGEVAELLNKCERALRAGDEDQATLIRKDIDKRWNDIDKRWFEGDFENLANLLARCDENLAVLSSLSYADDDVMRRGTWPITNARRREMIGSKYYPALSLFIWRRFQARPIPKAEIPDKAAAAFRDSFVRDRLVAALDWCLWARPSEDVRKMLKILDPHPFRDAVRDAVRSDDRAALVSLANRAEALMQPPSFAAFLGENDVIGLGRRRELLVMALQQQRPGDVGVLLALGGSYPVNKLEGIEERVRWYQAATVVSRNDRTVANFLALALLDKGDLDGAIFVCKQSLQEIAHKTSTHERSYNEGHRLDVQGQLQHLQRLRDALPRLPDVLAGKNKPKDPAEACDFGLLCSRPFQKRYADAVRLYKDAFDADPKLAENLWAAHRYNAAYYAALGGCDTEKDIAKQENKDRSWLRGQALTWMRADLVQLSRWANSSKEFEREAATDRLSHWLEDADLVGVRPGPERTSMPQEEAAAWDKLWDDVKATIALAQKAPIAKPGK